MKRKIALALLALLTAVGSQEAKGQVVINEVMAQNSNTIADPDYGASADWVELYNAGPDDVDLGGYCLTDNLSSPTKYALPEGTVIEAGGYLLVWCDGNATGLHTSFKLSADGERVALYSPEAELVDSVSFDVQYLDVSYGRRLDDTQRWAFFSTPTPGAVNDGEAFTGKANQPMILTRGGLFGGSVTVSITNDLGGTVHYTTDGSVPTADSPIYESPLTFTATTVLRARILDEGKMPGEVMTESYFVDEAFSSHQLPVVSIVSDEANFWDPSTGIYVQSFKPDWEVPVNIEMFLNNGSDRAAFNERAGIKVNGLYAWQLPQKMLGVYFKKKYGESKLAYQLFVDDARSSFDDFALRASGSDWSYTLMRDGLVQQAARKGGMNLDLMAFRPCVVYLNGQFLGIHNIREKVNKDYIKRHHDIGDADFDMVEGGDTPEEGDTEAWDAFFAKAKTTDLSDDANFEALAEEMDVENFTDYIISQSYCSNTSLDHNTMVWKTREGGKWRWILMDCDRGFFTFDRYVLNYVVKRDYWPLKQMFTNDGYRKYFCQRMADHLFTTFNGDEMCRQIDGHEADIAPLIDKHVARWLGTTSSYGNAMPSVVYWRNQVEALRDFARGRASILLDDLSNYGCEKPALLTISSEPAEACTFSFNGHRLPRTTWAGLYPKAMDITLQASDRDGFTFLGWRQTRLTDLIGRGSTWSYLDDGSDQGEAWREADFDDTDWKVGEAPLGYDFPDIATRVSYGSSSKKHYTTYFRRHFPVDNAAAIRSLKMQLRREDGAVVYINGQQVLTSNMPVDAVTYKTKAVQSMYELAGTNYIVYDIPVGALHDGDNVVAVEVHQVSSTSSDLSFDLQLEAETLDDEAPLLSTANALQLQLDGDTGLCAVYERDGQNVLPDSILSDMVLRKSGSPYLATRDVVVGADARLTIEPGVTILFSPGANMLVHGAMTADGTPQDSITFRLNPACDASKGWGALCFINTADRVSSLSYAELRDGSTGPKAYNCVAVLSGFHTTLRLDHLRITHNHANPVACRYSDLRLTNSLLHADITGDLANVKYGKGYIADCELVGNDQEDSDGIDYDGVTDGVIKRVVIRDFLGDNSDAIDIGEQAVNVCIDSVLVFDVTDKGVSVGQRSSARLTNCTFIQTNLGLGIKDSCYAEVDRCTFYGVRTPIASYEKVMGRAGGNVRATACVFANSFVDDVLCDDKSTVTIDGSLSDATELPYGSDNVMADPQFTAPSLYDLSSTSPLMADRGACYMPIHPNVQPIITELCYTPDPASGGTEYVVLSNVGDADINLSGYAFTQGISFTFPDGVALPAGESIYIVKETDGFEADGTVLKWDSGKLADEGETLELTDPSGVVVDQVRYLPSTPWPVISSNGSSAIMLTDRLKANNIATNWQQKPKTDVDKIVDIANRQGHPVRAYDLQGRPVDRHSAHGLLIIGGRTVLVK